MLTCDKCRDSLSYYHNNELEAQLVCEVEQHLQQCKTCRRDLELLQEMIANSKSVSVAPVSQMATLRMTKAIHQYLGVDFSAPRQFGDILDIEDLALYLKIPRTELEIHIHEMPHFYIGNHLRFRKEQIDHWISEREQEHNMALRFQLKNKFG